jgi:hypothetical protein
LSGHEKTLCNVCDKSDTHPKINVMGFWVKDPTAARPEVIAHPNWHHDCLPPEFVERYTGDPTHASLMEIRQKALDGVHGDRLREHIESMPHDDNGYAPLAEDSE